MNEREIGFRGGVNPLIVWPDILPMWFNHRNLVTDGFRKDHQPDCTPCGVKPSWSMLQFGYQLPADRSAHRRRRDVPEATYTRQGTTSMVLHAPSLDAC